MWLTYHFERQAQTEQKPKVDMLCSDRKYNYLCILEELIAAFAHNKNKQNKDN